MTRQCLYKWRAKLHYLELEEEEPRPNSHESTHRKQIRQSKRMPTLSVQFCLNSVKVDISWLTGQRVNLNRAPPLYPKPEMRYSSE